MSSSKPPPLRRISAVERQQHRTHSADWALRAQCTGLTRRGSGLMRRVPFERAARLAGVLRGDGVQRRHQQMERCDRFKHVPGMPFDVCTTCRAWYGAPSQVGISVRHFLASAHPLAVLGPVLDCRAWPTRCAAAAASACHFHGLAWDGALASVLYSFLRGYYSLHILCST